MFDGRRSRYTDNIVRPSATLKRINLESIIEMLINRMRQNSPNSLTSSITQHIYAILDPLIIRQPRSGGDSTTATEIKFIGARNVKSQIKENLTVQGPVEDEDDGNTGNPTDCQE